jgi:methylmalonyl-CoA mutase N-terminal domain/subunit
MRRKKTTRSNSTPTTRKTRGTRSRACKKIRAERDNAAVDCRLARLRKDAAEGRNVMPALMEAVKAYASVGEMTKELVAVFGRYQEPIRF